MNYIGNMMIQRDIEPELQRLLGEYPVVTILGPRQAGKTTLARYLLADRPGSEYAYCNLEIPEERALALEDPKGFLQRFPGKVILDEIQRVPELLSYIQARVDEEKVNGAFVLTGSHQLALRESIGQSLAGRTALLTLLPLSISEMKAAGIGFDRFEDYAVHGFLPRIHDQRQRPTRAWSNYYQTYVERDVRLLINLRDASLFEKFIRLLAGRVGQVMNQSSLANDVGVDVKTVGHWLSILEASFVVFRLPPYFENFGKRVIKSPKYYFTDVGLLCFLLGIERADQVARDPLVGAIFENLVVVELMKQQTNRGRRPELYFYRDSNGNEVDVLIPEGRHMVAVEIKAAATWQPRFFRPMERLEKLCGRISKSVLVYNGESRPFGERGRMLRFDDLAGLVN